MHLTVLEFTSILPVPFPEIQILIIIDNNMVLFVAGQFMKIPNHIRLAKLLITIHLMSHQYLPLNLWGPCAQSCSSPIQVQISVWTESNDGHLCSSGIRSTARANVLLEHVDNTYFFTGKLIHLNFLTETINDM